MRNNHTSPTVSPAIILAIICLAVSISAFGCGTKQEPIEELASSGAASNTQNELVTPTEVQTTPVPEPSATSVPPTATPSPTPVPTPDPLIAQVEQYFIEIEDISTLEAELSDDSSAHYDLLEFSYVSEYWKADFSALLDRRVQLYEMWVAIDPPELFRGYHETMAKSFAIAIDIRDLFTDWMASFTTDPLQVTSPWSQSVAYGEEQLNIIENARGALEYGLTEYAKLTGVIEPNINTESANEFVDGTYVVGTDIQSGTYRNDAKNTSCYWERLSGFGGTTSDIIANQITDDISIVTIDRSDLGFRSTDCGTWHQISP